MLKLTPEATRLVNETCACTSLDRTALQQILTDGPHLVGDLPVTHPHLFADAPVYVAEAEMRAMREAVTAIEAVAATPAYRALALERGAPVTRRDFGPQGVLMGYDFHLGEAGPQLIEINTNAGGAFLNAVACDAQRACCPQMQDFGSIACPPDLGARLVEMFRSEWRRQRGEGEPGLVAIVDDAPEQQYLHPEFLLAQALLRAHGLAAVIADPQALQRHGDALWLGDERVDLVYNRLVDFDFSEPRHQALGAAYAAGEVVVTPNPHHHALLADKRNLVILGDEAALRALGVAEGARTVLGAAIPRTRPVTGENAEAMWSQRAQLFFKPVAGHGGKAVYRGDKLTRKVWQSILAGGYVAQKRVAPSERVVSVGGERQRHKLDVRLYTYGGEMLLAAARLYQGQTTNFRTPGGGFAPVMVV